MRVHETLDVLERRFEMLLQLDCESFADLFWENKRHHNVEIFTITAHPIIKSELGIEKVETVIVFYLRMTFE